MKTISDYSIIDKADYGKSVWLLMKSESQLPTIKPGQFAQLRVDDSPTTYLRRPISIHNADAKTNSIEMLVQKVGSGTRHIAEMPVGAKINMVLPLGNGFTMPEKSNADTLLVGGGIGIAPLLLLGKELVKAGHKVTFLLGGRSQSDLLRMDEYQKTASVLTTTEDGSHGTKGFVTQHPVWAEKSFDNIYVCGPKPMMKAVMQKARESDTWCEVSLENKMACGLGACLCCVENTTEGNLCVCKEGPVFNINRLLW